MRVHTLWTRATSMMTPSLWLTEFLQRRQMREPDGRMLYAYRLSEQEYVSLRDLLEVWLCDDVLSGGGHLPFGAAECFVLYGAVWWQREYAGGVWRWDDVINSFGGDPDGWPPQFRTECVQIGLRFWKQKIGTARKRYFGVLVEQGGLPRALLAKAQGAIPGLIRAVLRRAARLAADLDDIAAMVGDYDEKLPQSLQNDTVHLLIAQVVRTVLDLKLEFKLTRGDNAVAKLDALSPDWRERFPIALDDQAAIALLSDLVGQAAAIESESRTSPVLAERFLREAGGVYSIISQVKFPKTIDAENLARLIGIDTDDLPFRFSIEMSTDRRQLAADVRRVLGSEPSRYQFTVLQNLWNDKAAQCEHLMCIVLSGGKHVSAPLPGGMELDPRAPWVFARTEDECCLIAQGSARIRQNEAYIVVDERWTVEHNSNQGNIEQLGRFVSVSPAKLVLKVSGNITVSDGENAFRIRTQQVGVENDRPVWEGRRFGFALNPTLAFYGLPKLCRYTADGERIVVPMAELEWRVAGTGRIISHPAGAKGTVDVLWRSHNEVRLRSRMTILDKNTLIRFQSGATPAHGTINLPASWEVDAVTCEDESLKFQPERKQNGLVLSFESIRQPPESVRLILDWKGMPVPCTITLPFPSSGGHFFDRHENQFANNAIIARDQLLGVRLKVFDADPDHPVQHKIVFSLHCEGLERLPAPVSPIESVLSLEDNRAEVRLIDYQNEIESLLTLSDALDAWVNVDLLTGRNKSASLRIKRYEFSLVTERRTISIASNDLSKLPSSSLSEIRMLAIPIKAMHKQAQIGLIQQFSEGVPAGRWVIPEDVTEYGHWLVYPAPDAPHSIRPVAVVPPLEPTSVQSGYITPPDSIEDVFLIGDATTRRAILSRRLTHIAEDYSHPDWQIVEGIWTNLGHLTLPSVDIWRALAMSPDALVSFVCRTWSAHSLEDVMTMCERFQRELGVIWESISIRTWRNGCKRLSEQWQKILPTELLGSIVPQQLADTLSSMRLHFPALNSLLGFVTFEETGKAGEVVAPITRTKLTEYRRRLWEGGDCALQNILLRNHLDRAAPRLDLYEELARAFFDKNHRQLQIPDSMRKTVLSTLWDPTNEKAGLANVPILLALCTINNLLPRWWGDQKKLIELRQYRDFDRTWFCHAFDQSVAMFLAAGIVSPRT